jgi:NAD(P)-dependent dehydrogenase (short-subunit alcohol dehydrogenase family)
MATWFITGASRGFGAEIARHALERGEHVVATARRPSAITERFGEHDRLLALPLDVTDEAQAREAVAAAVEWAGRIDVVVNNAGYGLIGAAEELTDEQIRHQIDTNLIGSIQVIRATLPHLRAQGGGRILQVSSEGGQIAYPNFSLYHATKWGIEGFIEAVAQEVAPFHIEFTIAEPGPSRTDFGRGLVTAPTMDVYDNTPAGYIRRAIASGAFAVKGDPGKMAQAMIDCVEISPAPRRLVMGSSSFTGIRAALVGRIAALDAQKDIALSTDADD